MKALVLAAVAALTLVPSSAVAQAQHHDNSQGGPLMILHDGPDDGYQFVGNLAHFGYMLVGDNGQPLPHHNGRFTVTLLGQEGEKDDVVLFDSPDMHDYDGLQGVDVVFPVAGPYQVTAVVPTDAGDQTATFMGHADEPADLVQADLLIEAPTQTEAFALEPFTITLVDQATGALLPHTDALVEIRGKEADLPFFRVHLHTHDEPMTFLYAFPQAGDFTVQVLGYVAFPSKGAGAFLPVAKSVDVTVTEGMRPLLAPDGATALRCTPATPVAASQCPPAESVRGNVVDVVDAEPYKVFGSYDPAAQQQLFSGMRTSVTLANATDSVPIAHVNFEAELKDPYRRVIFHSESLHEYDGVLEIFGRYGEYGRYVLTTTVQRGDVSADIRMPFHVTAPAPFFAAGATFTKVTPPGEVKSGLPAEFVFRNENAGGAPAQHSEFEVSVLREADGVPLSTSKLHTHSSGDVRAVLTFPEAGEWFLRVDPLTIHGEPTPFAYGPSMDEGRLFPVSVVEGVALPTVSMEEPDLGVKKADQGPLPSVGFVGAVLAALVAFLSRRR